MIDAIDTRRTFAVVVGVETYEFGPAWDLDGPASDAVRFVQWLRARGVPATNIRLHLAPLLENRHLMSVIEDVPAIDATREHILDSLERWLGERASAGEGDLLYVFWGGHGAITASDRRHVFCQDSSQLSARNIDLERRLDQFRRRPLSAFTHQIVLVDACATYYPVSSGIGIEEVVGYADAVPDPGVRQAVLYAASPGDVAENHDLQKTGAFSAVALEILRGTPEEVWPPEVDGERGLSDLVVARFEADEQLQKPALLVQRGWNGREARIGDAPLGGYIGNTLSRSKTSLRQHSILVNLLLSALPDSQAWAELVSTLPPPVKASLGTNQTPDTIDPLHVTAAVIAHDWGWCLLSALGKRRADSFLVEQVRVRLECYRVIGRAKELMDGRLRIGDIESIYYQSAGDRQRSWPGSDLEAVLEDLWDMAPTAAGGLKPLYEFVERAARRLQAPDLRSWVDHAVSDRTQLLDMRSRLDREQNALIRPVTRLLVDIPSFQSKGLDFWVYEGAETELVLKECAPCIPSKEGIEATLVNLVTERYNQVPWRLEVELFVPFDLIGWEAEELVWRVGASIEIALGNRIPVLLRWRERAQKRANTQWGAWTRTAARIRADNALCRSPRALWLPSDGDTTSLFESLEVESQDAAYIGLLFVAVPDQGRAGRTLSTILLAGAPYVLWSRRDIPDWETFKQVVATTLIQGPLDGIPHRAMSELRRGDNHRLPIALLWDNPALNPLSDHLRATPQYEV